MVSGSVASAAASAEDCVLLGTGALGRAERATPSFPSVDASESESLLKPARSAAVWSAVNSGVSSSSSIGAGMGFLVVFLVAAAAGWVRAEDFDFLSADFKGAGLSADFVILTFFDMTVVPSALLRFFAVAAVDIVAMDV